MKFRPGVSEDKSFKGVNGRTDVLIDGHLFGTTVLIFWLEIPNKMPK